ncbi:MAG: DegT/DnrJ/EryC1/StrS aminotransferase family protein [Clostridia bacterium]|nr:DegT/DnrJ/EryC1/StrS aminotransferase family protein [Clostridia bacterium]
MVEKGIEKFKVRNIYIASAFLDNSLRNKLEEVCKERYLNLRDYAGYIAYLNNDVQADTADALLRIVKPPIKNEKGDKRVIPFSPPDISEKEIGEVVEALRSGWITTGPRTKLLERRLAAFIETGNATYNTEIDPAVWSNRVVCLNSATAAEELNLRILGIQPGDEIIVPAYTYTASASAAIHCGATVKFVDIQQGGDKETHAPEMDYEKLEEAITPATKAIITVDLGGIVCDYDRVFDIVERKKSLFTPLETDDTPLGNLSSRIQHTIGRIAVVADCAHSLGASRVVDGQRKSCGAIADFSSFSFHAVKNFTTAEGGASTWKPLDGIENSEIYKFYQLLSLHGQSKDALAKTKVGAWEYDIVGPWYKCNMTDIMAAIGLRQLDRYPDLLSRREAIIRQYDMICNQLGLDHLVHHTDGMDSSNHLYLVRVPGISVEQRNQIIEKMAAQGVATNVHYKPLPMMTAYKELGWDIVGFPNTYAYYENLFTLPLHTLLDDEDIKYVCETLKKVISEVLGTHVQKVC